MKDCPLFNGKRLSSEKQSTLEIEEVKKMIYLDTNNFHI